MAAAPWHPGSLAPMALVLPGAGGPVGCAHATAGPRACGGAIQVRAATRATPYIRHILASSNGLGTCCLCTAWRALQAAVQVIPATRPGPRPTANCFPAASPLQEGRAVAADQGLPGQRAEEQHLRGAHPLALPRSRVGSEGHSGHCAHPASWGCLLHTHALDRLMQVNETLNSLLVEEEDYEVRAAAAELLPAAAQLPPAPLRGLPTIVAVGCADLLRHLTHCRPCASPSPATKTMTSWAWRLS
jgi:hypothetical protein